MGSVEGTCRESDQAETRQRLTVSRGRKDDGPEESGDSLCHAEGQHREVYVSRRELEFSTSLRTDATRERLFLFVLPLCFEVDCESRGSRAIHV